jgi:hypothetical protein
MRITFLSALLLQAAIEMFNAVALPKFFRVEPQLSGRAKQGLVQVLPERKSDLVGLGGEHRTNR